MKFKALVILMLFSTFARAAETLDLKTFGAISGGGGKGVVCGDPSGPGTTVELLDLWEARTLFGKTLPRPNKANLAADVDAGLVLLKDSYPFEGSGSLDGVIYQNQDFVLASLRRVAARFLAPNPSVQRLRGVTLTLTEDSFELAQPVNCPPRQLVNYQVNGHVLINEDLFEKMDEVNQAALIVHESLYSFLRDVAHEKNSIRTRRAVGYVFGGDAFSLAAVPTAKAKLTCVAGDWQHFNRVYVLSRGKDAKGTSHFEIYPEVLNGSRLMGTIGPAVVGGNPEEFLTKGFCPSSYNFASIFGALGSGPVEWDRDMSFGFRCRDGQFAFHVETSPPGQSETESLDMTCTYDVVP